VKTTGVGGLRGYDAGKKVSGRKRHILVDTQGLVLKARVHSFAPCHADGSWKERFPGLGKVGE
jgi:hypothetical protein